MKLTVVEEKPTPPPKKVVLELTEGEAGLLWYIVDYYAPDGPALDEIAGTRLRDSIPAELKDKAKYSYTDYFKNDATSPSK